MKFERDCAIRALHICACAGELFDASECMRSLELLNAGQIWVLEF